MFISPVVWVLNPSSGNTAVTLTGAWVTDDIELVITAPGCARLLVTIKKQQDDWSLRTYTTSSTTT